MNICVIFTGGTIGSSLSDGYVNLHSGCSSMLVDGYYRMCGIDPDYTDNPLTEESVRFEEVHPVSMLSENVSVDDLEKIIGAVREAVDSGKYRGIIVTHGTDTLSFTANVLSQVFADAPCPIVMVSALLPLEDPGTNGFENFKGAVDFIRGFYGCEGEFGRGVYVAFKNGKEDCLIHDAAYMLAADEITGYMHSLCGMYYGTMINGNFILNEDYVAPENEFGAEFFRKGLLCDEIVTIRSRALLNYKYYKFWEEAEKSEAGECKPRAVLIELYHSGTLCSRGDELNALKFIEKCRQEDIMVIIGPVKRGDNVYASMKDVTDNCIISYDQSFELTVAKTSLALGAGAGYDDLKRLLG